jgi:hypothetical protein
MQLKKLYFKTVPVPTQIGKMQIYVDMQSSSQPPKFALFSIKKNWQWSLAVRIWPTFLYFL